MRLFTSRSSNLIPGHLLLLRLSSLQLVLALIVLLLSLIFNFLAELLAVENATESESVLREPPTPPTGRGGNHYRDETIE